MQTMAEEWIEEGRVIGLRKGREEGCEEGQKEGETQGRIKTLRAMILHVLRRRFPVDELLLQAIEQHLAQISDEGSLNQLVDISLSVIVLPDFSTRLQEFVQPVN